MANEKEIWEIELEIKTAKIEAAQEKYNKFVKAREDGEKRIDELGKKLNNAGRNDYKESMEASKKFEQAVREDKKRTAALNNEYAQKQIQNINRIAEAQRKADQMAAKYNGQSSPISNFGVSNLPGQVGSQSYVNNLKSIRSEINPTSKEFGQLSVSIKQMQAELDKVNKSSGLQAFKSLTLSIKETKGELARLTQESKVGGAEWQKYSEKLRQLQRDKQLIQRETKLTSQQLISMSRDLTVVAYGLRQIGTDIVSLSDGKKTAGEFALAIGGIGLNTLAVLPAIHGLTKALEAAGIVSTATLTKLSALSSTIATAGGAIALFVGGLVLMVNTVYDGVKSFSDFKKVLDGSLDVTKAMDDHIARLTFGLIEANDAAGNVQGYDALNKKLEETKYLADFLANAFGDLQAKIQNALGVNMMKFLTFNKDPLSFAGPEAPNASNTEGWYDDKGTLHLGKKPTNKGGSSTKTSKQEKQEELNLIKLQEAEYEKLQKQYDKNIGDLGAQNQLRLRMLDIEREIFRLRTGVDVDFKNLPGGRSLDGIGTAQLDFKKGFKLKQSNSNDLRPEMTSEEFKALMDAEMAKEEAKLGYAVQMESHFESMLQKTGLIDDGFFQIINMIKGIVSDGSGFFGALGGLLGFLPGGGLISTVIGGASGGGMPNIRMPQRQTGNTTVIIKNPVTLGKGMEVETRYNDVRGSIDL